MHFQVLCISNKASAKGRRMKKETDMSEQNPQFIDVNGVEIALRHRTGEVTPGLVWLGGYCSDMLGGKAQHLDQWAQANDHAMLRFDYSGHGESGGEFKDGTISLWLEQSLAVYRAYTKGPQILIGSSMGGWLALRMAQELIKAGEAPAGLILLAPVNKLNPGYPDISVGARSVFLDRRRSERSANGRFSSNY